MNMLMARCWRWRGRSASIGGSPASHFALLAKEAQSGCVVDNSDTRLFIPGTNRCNYPNVVLTCGEEQRHHLLVSQDEVLVEQRVRIAPQEWRQRFFRDLKDCVTLSGGIVLPLSTIYGGIKLDERN